MNLPLKYLFFDIECASSRGSKYCICEFGYVITDNKFNILDKGEILINPDCAFDWFVVKNILTHTKKEYKESPKYIYYHEQIKNLLMQEDIMIFGYSVNRDALYLNYESYRYGLEYINYKFYDVFKLYYNIDGKFGKCSLKQLYENLECGKTKEKHSSLDDAIATCECLKKISQIKSKSVEELISLSNCGGETLNGRINGKKENFNKNIHDSQLIQKLSSIGEQLKAKGFDIQKLKYRR